MKRALEVLLAAAALALTGFVALRLLAPPAVEVSSAPEASRRPGRDAEDPSAPAAAQVPPRAVGNVAMIKLARPPRRRARPTEVPPAPVRP